MNDYRATVNLPGQPRGAVAPWPDSPRTAVLIGQGILVPVERALTEPLPDPEPPATLPLEGPASVPASAPQRPSAARKTKKAAAAPKPETAPADED